MKTRAVVTSTVTASVALVWGCGTISEQRLGIEIGGPPPSFVAEDAGFDAERGLTSYCPSSTCPTGFTTCPTSRFPCDVDVRTDPTNCGSCSFVCPKPALGAVFACVDGSCAMKCDDNQFPRGLDCDGLVDNGCEVTLGTDDNCGACGERCPDPTHSCVLRRTFKWGCGCGGTDLYCGYCLDPSRDDYNCGACEVACDPTGDGGAPPPYAYYGCINGECGHSKCIPNHADCDLLPSNGCEVDLFSDDNCGTCGNVCGPDEKCLPDPYGAPRCMCPSGKSYCAGTCVDFATDPFNCGDCGFSCGLGIEVSGGSFPTCINGSCGVRCAQGHADCTGSGSCEINTNSDPHNCGACGNACDGVAGQACVLGRCVVEPCEQAGGTTQ
jgi:hypothetical protein